MTPEQADTLIRELSIKEGFVEYGAAKAQVLTEDISRLKQSLNKGYNADMKYMAGNLHLREDPSRLLEGAMSVLCFLAPYKPSTLQKKNFPLIASYAYGKDYHKIIKDKLYTICSELKERIPDLRYRVFCDSAPVLERAWASKAGLGFIGKNSFLISKKHGLHTLIGVILLDKEVVYGEHVSGGCGSCTKCIDTCPAGAIVSPKEIDSRRCISYQTIESGRMRSEEDFPASDTGWIFGCDICLNACPWSAKGDVTSWKEFSPLTHGEAEQSLTETSYEDWLSMDEEYFKKWFSNSPLMRAGLNKIKNNIR